MEGLHKNRHLSLRMGNEGEKVRVERVERREEREGGGVVGFWNGLM